MIYHRFKYPDTLLRSGFCVVCLLPLKKLQYLLNDVSSDRNLCDVLYYRMFVCSARASTQPETEAV